MLSCDSAISIKEGWENDNDDKNDADDDDDGVVVWDVDQMWTELGGELPKEKTSKRLPLDWKRYLISTRSSWWPHKKVITLWQPAKRKRHLQRPYKKRHSQKRALLSNGLPRNGDESITTGCWNDRTSMCRSLHTSSGQNQGMLSVKNPETNEILNMTAGHFYILTHVRKSGRTPKPKKYESLAQSSIYNII